MGHKICGNHLKNGQSRNKTIAFHYKNDKTKTDFALFARPMKNAMISENSELNFLRNKNFGISDVDNAFLIKNALN